MIKYIEAYISLCKQLNDGTTAKDVRCYNRVMKRIIALQNEIEELCPNNIIEIMNTLLDNSDPRVKMEASAFCLSHNILRPRVNEFFQEIKKRPNDYSWRIRGWCAHYSFCIKQGMYDE